MDYTKVEKLLSIEEIKNLRIRYTYALDQNDMDGASSVFSEDAVCQTDREPWNGRQEIKEGLQKAFRDHDTKNNGRYPFLHLISNHLIEIIDDNTATGSCYLIDHVTQRRPDQSPLLLLGVYRDRYKKINDQWYITNSDLDVVWPTEKQ